MAILEKNGTMKRVARGVGLGRLALTLAAGLLAGCASGSSRPEGDSSAGGTTERLEAAEAESLREPALQEGLLAAEAEIAEAEAARKAGDGPRAEAAYLAALETWPINRTAWRGLEALYEAQGRTEDLAYARFFAARMDWANEQPPLIAAAAFQNLAEGRTPWQAPDPRYGETAAEARLFLRQIDREGRFRPPPEAVPWYLAILPSGAITALLLASAGV